MDFEFQYDSYDGYELFKLGVHVGQLGEAMYGKRAANAAMLALIQELLVQIGREELLTIEPYATAMATGGWRAVWQTLDGEDSHVSPGDYDITETAQWCCELYLYGIEGYSEGYDASGENPLTVEQQLRQMLDWSAELLANVPAHWLAPLDDLPKTIAAAQGRWKLDITREALTVEEVAALAKVSAKTIRNLLSKGDLQREGSTIPADAAGSWLNGSPNFKPSTWRDAEPRQKPEAAPSIDRPVFVPHDGDGRAFLPDVKTPGGYVLGSKGAEEKFDDFWAALNRLQEMDTPRWRRPSTGSGRPSIVIGKGWKRMSIAEIEQMLAG